MSLYEIASVLPVCVGLGFMVGCNDGMASVGYVTGPSFIPFEGVTNAFYEYGMPAGRKGASNGFYIWLGFCFIVAIIRWAKEESAKVIEAAIRKAAKKPRGELTKADYEKVTVLELYENQLTDVKGLEKLTQLEGLYLSINQLTDVKGLEKLTQLKELRLGGNQLTDVKGLEKLTKLKELYLAKNQLTNVKGLDKLTQLKKLFLSYNQLTFVKGLEKLTQLKHLYLHDNPDLTKAQIDQLKKALPKCEITSNPTK